MKNCNKARCPINGEFNMCGEECEMDIPTPLEDKIEETKFWAEVQAEQKAKE